MKLCGALGRVGDQIADAGAKTQPSCSSTCRPGSLARDADDQIVADEFESEQARRPKEWFDIGQPRRWRPSRSRPASIRSCPWARGSLYRPGHRNRFDLDQDVAPCRFRGVEFDIQKRLRIVNLEILGECNGFHGVLPFRVCVIRLAICADLR